MLIGAGRPNGSRPRLRSCPRVMRDTGPARPPCAGRRLPQASGLRGRRGPTRLDERGLAAPHTGVSAIRAVQAHATTGRVVGTLTGDS